MNMRVQEIAKMLADRHIEAAQANVTVRDFQFRLDERAAVVLVGVSYSDLGKNEKERELVLGALLRADAEWLRLHRECHKAREVQVKAQGELDALKALRRGEEAYIFAMQARLPVREVAKPSSNIVPFMRDFGDGVEEDDGLYDVEGITF